MFEAITNSRLGAKLPRFTMIDALSLAFALFVVGPLAYFYFDNTPPQVRLHGYITSASDPNKPPRVGENFTVHWTSTPHVRDCPGEVQVEIMQGDRIWPVLAKRKAMNPDEGNKTFTPPPWPLPGDIRPGQATYRVSTFWDCNWLQIWLPWHFITEVGPDIEFTVLPAK